MDRYNYDKRKYKMIGCGPIEDHIKETEENLKEYLPKDIIKLITKDYNREYLIDLFSKIPAPVPNPITGNVYDPKQIIYDYADIDDMLYILGKKYDRLIEEARKAHTRLAFAKRRSDPKETQRIIEQEKRLDKMYEKMKPLENEINMLKKYKKR